MNKLTVNLENCFGIEKMNHEFDFSRFNTNVIYASNGVMKTSFANTFKALETGGTPSDRLYGKNSTYEVITDENPINVGIISVIKSFENINTEGSQTKLLVDQATKEEYDTIYSTILGLKKKLIADLNRISGIKQTDIESQMVADFGGKEFYTILSEFVDEELPNDFSEIKYSEIFNNDVLAFLSKPDVQENIELYFSKYKELLEGSVLFKTGVFNPAKAENVASTLKKENFFQADHTVKLNGVDQIFDSYDSLNTKLLEERSVIINDTDLLKIEKQIKKVAVKNFRELLEKKDIVVELADLNAFKIKLWRSYLHKHLFHINELNSNYNAGYQRLKEIEEQATQQVTAWDEVIKKFNERFFVPFSVEIENKASSILGKSVPNVKFVFNDSSTGQVAVLKSDELGSQEILSQGEKRAMYLLNVMFNIEARKNEGLETLFIIDDIADSFDYKNKYAIVQYLQDLTSESNFNQIILTHNFDFFRTLQSRVLGGGNRRDCSFMAEKNDTGIQLIGSGHMYQDNPFKHWKSQLSNKQMLIASIPFVRNLIEFKGDDSSEEFITLTSLLHMKANTRSITIKELKDIYGEVIESNGLDELDETEFVFNILEEELININSGVISSGINLEEKIILSIGIRIKAEEHMWSKVTDQTEITKNQTWKLFKRFKTEFEHVEEEAISLIDQVNLITPENIHLNSFMFEPILDLSIDHLKQLYTQVSALN